MIDFIKYPLIILSLFSLFFKVNSQLKIPLTYFPKYKYNDSSPSTIITDIIFQRLYANIEIGTPKSTIQIPLLFDTNEFFIGDEPLNLFDNKSFSDLKFYSMSKSSSDEEEDDSYDIDFCGVYFMLARHMRDYIYFGDRKEYFSFYVPISFHEVLSGGIGMRLISDNHVCDKSLPRNRSFFELLKMKNIINRYDFSIFFNSKEYKREEEGFLLLGGLPQDVDEDLGYYKKEDFDEEKIKKVNMKSYSLKFDLDKVLGYYGKNQNNLIEDFTSRESNFMTIELDFNDGGIQIPLYLMKFYQQAFEGYLGNLCYNETFSGWNKKFFYCKKEIGKDINKIKEKFPGVIFQSNDLNYTFTLEADDLFVEIGNNIYCLVYFYSNTDGWKLGKPFLKKYQFSFNYDAKNIIFYQNYEVKKVVPIYVLIIAIVGTLIVVGVIAFLVFKFYFGGRCLRKKRANELQDDDYAYTSKDEEKIQNAKNDNNQEQQNNDENDQLGINSE